MLIIIRETNSGALGAFGVGHVKLILRLEISADLTLEECDCETS